MPLKGRSYNDITKLDIGSCSQLYVLECYNNRIEELNISCLPIIQELYKLKSKTSNDIFNNVYVTYKKTIDDTVTIFAVDKYTNIITK